MPDSDPASRKRTEKAKALDSRVRGNDDWGRSQEGQVKALTRHAGRIPVFNILLDCLPASWVRIALEFSQATD